MLKLSLKQKNRLHYINIFTKSDKKKFSFCANEHIPIDKFYYMSNKTVKDENVELFMDYIGFQKDLWTE